MKSRQIHTNEVYCGWSKPGGKRSYRRIVETFAERGNRKVRWQHVASESPMKVSPFRVMTLAAFAQWAEYPLPNVMNQALACVVEGRIRQ